MFEKQNEEQFIELLFLQRQKYTSAGNWNRALWILAILTAVIGNSTKANLSEGLRVFIIAVMSLIALFAYSKLKKNIIIGAYTKELFDRSLFDLPVKSRNWKIKPNEIKEMAYKLKLKHSEKFQLASINSGEDKSRGLKDWYTKNSFSNKNKSIFTCQSENIWWDKNISVKYKIVLSVMAVIALLGLFLTNINKSLLEITISLFSNITLVIKLIDDLVIQQKFNDHHKKVEVLLENIREKTKPNKQDIEKIQEQLLLRRSMSYLPFDFLHKINRFNFHKLWRRVEAQ